MADLSLAAVNASNMPSEQKTAVRRFWESAMGVTAPARQAANVVREGAQAVRMAGVATVVGAGLGLIEAEFDTLDAFGKYPIDGILGFGGLVASAYFANDAFGVSPIMREGGGVSWGMYVARRVREWRSDKLGKLPNSRRASMRVTTAGEVDPVLALAAEL